MQNLQNSCLPRFSNEWIADFETTPETQYKKEGKTRVWLYYLENVNNEKSNIGLDIKSFLDFFVNTKGNHKVFFHNLARFDGEFIFWGLLLNGYTPKDDDKELSNKEFFRCRGGFGIDYYFLVKVNNKFIKFQCSYLLLSASVDDLAKVSKNFQRKKVFKYDYSKEHYETELSQVDSKEIEYIINDVRVVKEAYLNFKKQVKRVGLTKASTCFNEFKLANNMYYESLKDKITILENLEYHKWYQGGFTYLNNIYQDMIINSAIYVYDVNSLYPFVMLNFDMPVGKELNCTDDKCTHYKLLEILVVKAKIKEGHIPFINMRNIFRNDYLKEINKITLLHVTHIDLALIEKYYDIKYNVISRHCFKTEKNIFKSYIDKWFGIKLKAPKKSWLYEHAKLMLNSLYGKFGSKAEQISKGYIKDDKGFYNGWKEVELTSESKTVFYNPIAIFITSFARMILIETIQKNKDSFIYCDTDSIHSLKPLDLKIHDTMLGAWKFEGKFNRGKYIKRKQYILENEKGLLVKVAGLSRENQNKITFDNFNVNETIIKGKLMRKKVVGGYILVETDFVIKSEKIINNFMQMSCNV